MTDTNENDLPSFDPLVRELLNGPPGRTHAGDLAAMTAAAEMGLASARRVAVLNTRRPDKTTELIHAVRRELQTTGPEHRVALVSRSRAWADRVLEALDPHERERVDVSIPEEVT